MAETAEKQTLGFQTEVSKLLHLMVHSLYSNKEIFLRELISNASDAVDKLRFESLTDGSLLSEDPDLKIRIEFDKEANTVSIIDNGIGMSREDVIEHLGTIAKSGTSQFLESLSGDQQKDSQMIGQFGVGFYSSFIVAKQVEVLSRKAGAASDTGVKWVSEGEGEFTVENIDVAKRGTTIVVHLNEDESEFADGYRLRNIIRKYSDHISLPVEMEKEEMPSMPEEGDEGETEAKKEEDKAPEYEAVNKATALWTRSRSEITDEEYKEFYKHISHDFEEPATWSHNRVEGKLEYNSLLYIPKRAPFDMYNRDAPKGLKLYVQRVFIMDEAEQFLPSYLRFIKGILDSNDLPLNISREILQGNKSVESMKSALTKRVLDMLIKLAKNDKDGYQGLWQEFGQVLKEGPGEDFSNKEKVAKLLRFATTSAGGEGQTQSLEDYVGKMKEGQNKIYYISGESYNAVVNSPHIEVFRKKGIDVILMTDRIDEWMMSYLTEFDGKQFENISKGELDLGELADNSEKDDQEKLEKTSEEIVKRVKEALADKVEDVRVTTRLTDSPACLVLGNNDMGAQMQQIMKAAGQAVPETKATLEINPSHPIVEKMKDEIQEDRFKDLALVVFDQATLAEGSQLDDPSAYVKRINNLLLEISK